MNIFKHIPWFRKPAALNRGTVWLEQQMKGNPLWGANPDRLVNAVTAWDAGYISELARIITTYEMHDDTAKSCVRKRDAAVARCEHTILIEEGFEEDPRAQLHKEILTRFWATVRVTSAFNRAERGGIRLLKKQMMSAQSIGWSCHNIVWDVSNPREIKAQFIHLPMWHFENTHGELRFKTLATDIYGVPMAEGEWLVHTGDAIGPAVALACCTKRLSLQDWMLFSERAATPGLLGKTGAMPGTDAWNKLAEMLNNWGRAWVGMVDRDTDITTVSLNGSGEPPMPRLVERMDRAIASLYRGADLSTLSKGEGLGASLQGEESDMLEIDDCIGLSESLHEQVDRFVIRYMTGDEQPLAYIWIEPVSKPNIDAEIKVDSHLMSAGVKLSKRDMLRRYGRAEADPNEPDDAATLQQPSNDPQNPLNTPLNGRFAAPAPSGASQTPFKTRQTAFKNARSDLDGQGHPPATPPAQIEKKRASSESGGSRPVATGRNEARPSQILEAVAKDTAPAAQEIERFLKLLESGATDEAAKEQAAAIMRAIPSLLPEDPALAAVIAEAMAEAYAAASERPASAGPLANSTDCRANNPAHCPTHGTPREPETNPQHDRYGITDPLRLAAEPERNYTRAKSALAEMLRNRGGYVDKAAFRPETGWIRFDWGDAGNPKADYKGGHGISHIAAKHPNDLSFLPVVIARGEAYRHPTDSTKTYFVQEGRFAVVASLHKGAKKTITEYAPDKPKQLEEIKKYPRAAKPGENKGG